MSHKATIRKVFAGPIICIAWIGGAPAVLWGILHFTLPSDTAGRMDAMIQEFILNHWQWMILALMLILIIYLYFQIHDLITPKVSIEYEYTNQYLKGEHHPLHKDKLLQTIMIGLSNNSHETLNDCVLRLIEVVDQDGMRHITELPAPLQLDDGSVSFQLRPSLPKYAYVASSFLQEPGARIIARIFNSKSGHNIWLEIPNNKYKIKIGLYPHGKPCIRVFDLFVTDSGFIEMQPEKEESLWQQVNAFLSKKRTKRTKGVGVT